MNKNTFAYWIILSLLLINITLIHGFASIYPGAGSFLTTISSAYRSPSDTAHHTLAMLHRKRCPARQVLPTTLLRCVERMEQ